MNYLKSLFEKAKNAVTTTKNVVASTISSMVGAVKAKIAETVVDQLGPDVIKVGAGIMQEKLTEAVKDVVKQYSPANTLKAFLNTPAPLIDPYEVQFGKLLYSAKEQLHTFTENADEISQVGSDIALGLIDKLDSLMKDCFKLKKKTIKEFSNEGLKAIRALKPRLEQELTNAFVDSFITPFINFLVDILKSMLSINTTTPALFTPAAPRVPVAMNEENDDVEDVDYPGVHFNM